ncbi:MAG: hypothetical protein ACKOXB_10910 [Flavobacteriales bacterium]
MRIKIFIVLLLTYAGASAQGGANSVYSQYGFGMLYTHQFGQSFGMGNTGIAMSNPLNLNLYNPASIADLKYVTFDISTLSNSIRAKDGINTPASYTDGTMGSMGMGIPLLKNWGLILGLTPYSSMGYRITRTSTNADFGDITDYYQGQGGINSLFLGTGYRYRNFALGAKTNYLFGTFSQDQLRVLNSSTYFNSYYHKQYTFSNLTFDFGAQYRLNINENLNFMLGAVYGLDQQLSVRTAERQVQTTQTTLSDIGLYSNYIKNVIYDNTGSPSRMNVTYPQFFGGGIAMNFKEKLAVTADYRQQNWEKSTLTSSSYTTGRSYALGAEWVPNKNTVGSENYHKRIAYRMGLRYANLPFTVNGTTVNDYGFNIGAAFPLRKFKYERELFGSYINLGLEFGRRGSLNSNLVQEDYFKVNFGFTFNDKWFIKRKFD